MGKGLREFARIGGFDRRARNHAMFLGIRHTLGVIGVGLALLLGGMGMLITFVPGAEAKWFGVAEWDASTMHIGSPSFDNRDGRFTRRFSKAMLAPFTSSSRYIPSESPRDLP